MIANMKARLLQRRKVGFPDGATAEIVIWLLPDPVHGSSHTFKYRLYFGVPGKRLIGYDNERGKGDHRHIGEREEPYDFIDPPSLLADFWRDVDNRRASGPDDDDPT